jgi:hypothetical protein
METGEREGREERGERVMIPLSVILGAQKCESLNQLKKAKKLFEYFL